MPLASRDRSLLLLVVLHLSLAALFLWASSDTLTVRIEAQGSRMLATVNGYPLIAEDDRYPTGGAALWLGDQHSYRNYVPLSGPDGTLRGLLARLWRWDLGSNPQAGWKGASAEGQQAGEGAVAFEGNRFMEEAGWRRALFGGYRPSEPGLAAFGDPSWQDYTL